MHKPPQNILSRVNPSCRTYSSFISGDEKLKYHQLNLVPIQNRSAFCSCIYVGFAVQNVVLENEKDIECHCEDTQSEFCRISDHAGEVVRKEGVEE